MFMVGEMERTSRRQKLQIRRGRTMNCAIYYQSDWYKMSHLLQYSKRLKSPFGYYNNVFLPFQDLPFPPPLPVIKLFRGCSNPGLPNLQA